MPNVPIVDAHLHIWDPDHFRMPWLDANPLLNRRYGLEEYREATSGLDLDGMVYVQTDVAEPYALLEAQWGADQAARDPRIRGIVAFAPLEDGDRARSYLDALVAISPLIKGVRRMYQGATVDFCLRPDFIRGVQLLPDYHLSFDICLTPRHLATTLQFVRQCPRTAFILDHIAKPNVAARLLDPWQQQLRQLAGFPNVCCKISGVVTEAATPDWTVDDIKPYILHALDAFGEDRVVFGGDWPVVLHAAPYLRWVEALDAITSDLPARARRKLWAENAVRFYGL